MPTHKGQRRLLLMRTAVSTSGGVIWRFATVFFAEVFSLGVVISSKRTLRFQSRLPSALHKLFRGLFYGYSNLVQLLDFILGEGRVL